MPDNKSLFKYTDIYGARRILEDGTILFSSPMVFNDPFDVSIGSLFAYAPLSEENLDKLNEEFVKLLFLEDGCLPANESAEVDFFWHMKKNLQRLSIDQKNVFKEKLIPGLKNAHDTGKIQKTIQSVLDYLKNDFTSVGITCFCKRCDNILMWSHYADKHKGVVFELVPNIEKDSFLILAKDVAYSGNRPIAYESPRDFWEKSLFVKKSQFVKEYTDKLIYTKSLDWSVEEEVRVSIPDYIDYAKGQESRAMPFWDNELKSVYLGCRIEKSTREEVIDLALKRNSKVQIYQMVTSKNNFQLISSKLG